MEKSNDLGIVQGIKELGTLYKEHPILIVTTLFGMIIGAVLGALAFYNGWLG